MPSILTQKTVIARSDVAGSPPTLLIKKITEGVKKRKKKKRPDIMAATRQSNG